MSFFGSSPKTPVLIFDIGGTSVGAALVLLASGEKPYIVHTVREWLRPMEEVSLSRLTGLLEVGIDSVSKDMLALGARRLAHPCYGGALLETRQTHFFHGAKPFANSMSNERFFSGRDERKRRPDRRAADVKNKNRGFVR